MNPNTLDHLDELYARLHYPTEQERKTLLIACELICAIKPASLLSELLQLLGSLLCITIGILDDQPIMLWGGVLLVVAVVANHGILSAERLADANKFTGGDCRCTVIEQASAVTVTHNGSTVELDCHGLTLYFALRWKKETLEKIKPKYHIFATQSAAFMALEYTQYDADYIEVYLAT